jgi:hypothetical protein
MFDAKRNQSIMERAEKPTDRDSANTNTASPANFPTAFTFYYREVAEFRKETRNEKTNWIKNT